MINTEWTFPDLVEAMGHDVLELESFVFWYLSRLAYLATHWGSRYEQRMRRRIYIAQAWMDQGHGRVAAVERFGIFSIPLRYYRSSERVGKAAHRTAYRETAKIIEAHVETKMRAAVPRWHRDGLDYVAALILTGGLPLRHGVPTCVVGQLVKIAAWPSMLNRVQYWADELDLDMPQPVANRFGYDAVSTAAIVAE